MQTLHCIYLLSGEILKNSATSDYVYFKKSFYPCLFIQSAAVCIVCPVNISESLSHFSVVLENFEKNELGNPIRIILISLYG